MSSLAPGEHVDLDSGVTVKRHNDPSYWYTIEKEGERITLSASEVDELRWLVESKED